MSDPVPGVVHVLEPNPDGHRMPFVAWMLDDAPTDRRWVLHTSPEGLAHPACRVLRARGQPHVAFATVHGVPRDPGPGVWDQLRHEWRKCRVLHRHLRGRVDPHRDVILIPYVDDLLKGLALGPWWFAGQRMVVLGMRDTAHFVPLGLGRRRQAVIRHAAWRVFAASARCAAYLSNQAALCLWMRRDGHPLAGKTLWLPDPADDPVPVPRAIALQAVGLDPRRRWILAYGGLTPRKGVLDLLAMLDAPAWPEECGVILAGRCDARVRCALRARGEDSRLRVYDRFIDQATENNLFQGADLIYLAYRGHDHMSGCLVQAGRHARPVIASCSGMVGWYAARFGLGVIVDPGMSVDERLRRIRALLADRERCRRSGERGRRAFAAHTVSRFRHRMHAVCRRAARTAGGHMRT